MPRVTVHMPVFNGERFLRDAIDSVLAQDFPDFDLLAVDDGSTDESVRIIGSYGDPRIRIIAHSENHGIVERLNQGSGDAHGEYVARMDSDDIYHPSRILTQVRFLVHNLDIAASGTFYESWGRVADARCASHAIRKPSGQLSSSCHSHTPRS